jgi:hypothetical protein
VVGWSKAAKVAWKVGKNGFNKASALDAFADNIQDAQTLLDPNASTSDKVVAALSLASELLPVSASDVKDARRVVNAVVDGAGDTAKKSAKRTPRRPTAAQKEGALERSRGPRAGKPNSAEIDHVDSYSRGGETVDANLEAACRTCNRSKGAKELGTEWVPPKERQ